MGIRENVDTDAMRQERGGKNDMFAIEMNGGFILKNGVLFGA